MEEEEEEEEEEQQQQVVWGAGITFFLLPCASTSSTGSYDSVIFPPTTIVLPASKSLSFTDFDFHEQQLQFFHTHLKTNDRKHIKKAPIASWILVSLRKKLEVEYRRVSDGSSPE